MNCFQTTKGTISNEFWKQKQANWKLGFRDFICDTSVETWKLLPDVFKSDAIPILAIPIQTYLS